MKQRPRIYYTESQKALMWDRWRKGESLQQIAQLFDRHHPSIQRILAETGGIRPAQRRRSPDTASVENLRNYQLNLIDHGISPVSLNAAITGLKFIFDVTADHPELTAKT
jgi:hypothetical protein